MIFISTYNAHGNLIEMNDYKQVEERYVKLPSQIDMIETGKGIDDLIKRSGLSSEEISEKCGVSIPAVSQWRHGKKMPNADNVMNLKCLFQGCGLPVGDIYVLQKNAVRKRTVKVDGTPEDRMSRLELYYNSIRTVVKENTPKTNNCKVAHF